MTDLNRIVEELSTLTVMEVANLAKMLEEKMGVSAAAPVAAASIAEKPAEVATEKTEFDVYLTEIGEKKIQVIKEVRDITNMGLKDTKDLIDKELPALVKKGTTQADAEDIKAKLEGAGAKVEIK